MHIEAVETQVLTGRSCFVVCAHPREKLGHLVGAVDGENERLSRFLSSPFAPVDVAVRGLASSEIAFQGEGAHAALLDQGLEHVQLQLLELPAPMSRFAQGHYARASGHRHLRNRSRVAGELVGVGGRARSEAAVTREHAASRYCQHNHRQ